jgi:hypothetical protein
MARNVLFLVILSFIPIFTSFDSALIVKTKLSYPIQKPLIVPEYFIPSKYKVLVEKICFENKVPVWIFARLIGYESGWDKWKTYKNTNGTTDKGIAMLNSAYMSDWAWFYNNGKAVDPFDPLISLKIAAKHLAVLFKETGDWRQSVAAYNCGLSRTRSKKGIPIRTQRYVDEIFCDVEDIEGWNRR